MISFKQYIEEHLDYPDPFESIRLGKDNRDIETRRDEINSALLRASKKSFLTAYIGLGRMSQVLAPYGMFVPQITFLDGERGHKNFNITQFGDHHGGNKDTGEIGTYTNSGHIVYFEYKMNDDGMFDIFCEIIDKKGLEDIQNDLDNELEEGEDD